MAQKSIIKKQDATWDWNTYVWGSTSTAEGSEACDCSICAMGLSGSSKINGDFETELTNLMIRAALVLGIDSRALNQDRGQIRNRPRRCGNIASRSVEAYEFVMSLMDNDVIHGEAVIGDGMQCGFAGTAKKDYYYYDSLHARGHNEFQEQQEMKDNELAFAIGLVDEDGDWMEFVEITIDLVSLDNIFTLLKRDVCSDLNFTFSNKFALARR